MKVNLDEVFEKWKSENEDDLKEKFLEIHGFQNFLEEEWKNYQNTHGLIDESNEDNLSNCCNAPIKEDSDVCSECGEHCSSANEVPEPIESERQENFCN